MVTGGVKLGVRRFHRLGERLLEMDFRNLCEVHGQSDLPQPAAFEKRGHEVSPLGSSLNACAVMGSSSQARTMARFVLG